MPDLTLLCVWNLKWHDECIPMWDNGIFPMEEDRESFTFFLKGRFAVLEDTGHTTVTKT